MAISVLASGSLILATGGIFHLLENRRPLEDIDRKRHLKFDLAVVVVTSLMVAGITIMLIDGIVTQWLRDNVQLFDEAVSQPLWIRVSLALVVGDLGYYAAHRMMHTPLLWPTHVLLAKLEVIPLPSQAWRAVA